MDEEILRCFHMETKEPTKKWLAGGRSNLGPGSALKSLLCLMARGQVLSGLDHTHTHTLSRRNSTVFACLP